MVRSVVCGLAITALLAGQERQPAYGTVVDADGAAAAAVRVSFAGTPWFGEVEAPTDVVEVVTDARGRYLARLLTTRVYSAFACGTADAAGRFACSAVEESVLAGSQLALRLQPPRRQQRVVLRGAEAWADRRPLRLEAMPQMRAVQRLPIASQDLAPPMPPIARVLVLDRDGEVLWQQIVAADASGRAPTRDLAIELPPPRTVAVQVTDAVGRPLAGAAIDHCTGQPWQADDGWLQQPSQYCWRRLCVTDRSGRASVQLPAAIAAGGVSTGVHLRVRAAGHAEGHAGTVCHGRAFVDGKESLTAAMPVWTFALERAPQLHVRGAGAGDELLLFVTMATGDRIIEESQRVPASAALLPTPAQLERGSLLVSLPHADIGPVFALAEADGNSHRVDLHARRVSLRVRNGDGGPAEAVLAVALPWDRTLPFTPLLPVPLDQGGRGRIGLGGGDWLVLATAGDAIAWRSLRAADGDQDWQLDMKPMPMATARAIGRNGKPVAGARVCNVRLNRRGDFAWTGECGTLANILMRLQPRLLQGRSTDASGLVRLPVFPLTCWSIGVQLVRDGATSEFTDLVQGEVVDVWL